jgi:hypothetical protein
MIGWISGLSSTQHSAFSTQQNHHPLRKGRDKDGAPAGSCQSLGKHIWTDLGSKAKGSFAPLGLDDFLFAPTACAVGFILAPLRGWGTLRIFFAQLFLLQQDYVGNLVIAGYG